MVVSDEIKNLQHRIERLLKNGVKLKEKQKWGADINSLLEKIEEKQKTLTEQNKVLLNSQRALENERLKYKALYEHAPIAYLTVDRKGDVLKQNFEATQLLYSVWQQNISYNIIETVKPDSRQLLKKLLKKCFDSRTSQSGELVLQQSQKKPIYCSAHLALYRDYEAQEDYCRVTLTDITYRKDIEETLQEQRDTLKELLRQSPNGIVILDEKGDVIDWNPAMEYLTGMKPKDALKRPVWQVMGELLPQEIRSKKTIKLLKRQTLEALREGYSPWLNQVRVHPIQCINGTPKKVEVTQFLLHYGNKVRLGSILREVPSESESGKHQSEDYWKYKAFYENAPLGIFRSTLDGKIMEVNATCASLYGYDSPKEMYEKVQNVSEQLYVKTHLREELVKNCLENSQQKNKRPDGLATEVMRYENVYRKKDGTHFTANLYLQPVLNDKGKVLFLEGMIEDITDRKRMEVKLKESSEMLEQLVDLIPYPIYAKDDSGTFILVNEAGANFAGREKQTMLGHRESEWISNKGVLNAIEQEDKRILDSGYPLVKPEDNHVDKNGKEYVFQTHKVPFKLKSDSGGTGGKGIIGVSIDITEQIEAKRAMAESEQQYRMLAENSTDIIALFKDYKKIYISPAVKAILGFTPEEFMKFGDFERVHPEDALALRETITSRRAAKKEGFYSYQYRQKHKNGYYVWLEANVQSERKKEDEILSLMNIRDITAQKISEEALKASEEKFKAFFHSSLFGTIEGDIYGGIHAANDKFLQIIGYSREEIASGNVKWDGITPQEFQVLEQEKVREAQEKGMCTPYEKQYIRKDGSRVWVMVGYILLGEQRERSMAFILDIDKNKNNYRELTQKKNYLSALNRASSLLFERQHEKTYFEEYINIIGKAAQASRCYIFLNHFSDTGERLISQAAEWCVPGIEPQINNPELQNLSYATFSRRWEKVLSGGDIIKGKVSGFPQSERDILEPQNIRFILTIPIFVHGTFHGFMGFDNCESDREWSAAEEEFLKIAVSNFQYAIERDKAMQDLEASEEKYRSVITTLNDGIVMRNRNGEVITCNAAAERILGVSADQLSGLSPVHPDWKVISEDGIPLPLEKRPPQIALNTGQEQKNVVLGIAKPDKSVTWINMNVEPVYQNNRSELLGVVSSITDITELKEKEEQLKESNATKDRFFSIIAHDLRSPFNTLISLISLINLSQKNKEDIDLAIFEQVEEVLWNGKELLENLLNWSRSQTGRISFRPEPFDVLSMMEEVTGVLRNTAKEKGVELISELDEGSQQIVADRQMISTILRNLTANAIKFTPKNGKVTLRTQPAEQDKYIFAVADTGVGISPKDQDKMFRIDAHFTTPGTNNEKGSGLGLILCKEFVEKHQGDLWVESEERKGSTFYFSIPKQSGS